MSTPTRLFLAVSLLSLGAMASAQVSSFDTTDEGWTYTSFNNPNGNDFGVMSSGSLTYNLTGGNGGGYVSKTDPDSGDFYFIAPSAFLGNQSSASKLTYDLIYNGIVDYQTHDVVLVGTAKRLIYHASPNIVPNASWSSFTVSLSPASTWLNGIGGPVATAADFSEVLGNLQGLFIKGEYTNGVTETTGLDNVRLDPVPEPASIVAIGIGLGFVSKRKRKHR